MPLAGGEPVHLTLDATADLISLVTAGDTTAWQPDECCITVPGSDLSTQREAFGGGAGNTIPSLLYTSRGFAVVMAHVKLGPEGVQNDVAKQMVDSLLPQMYRAAELGYIDLSLVALSGQSYGGYSTALIASQTNLFRAGIPVNGVFDIAGSYGRIDRINVAWAEGGQGRMGTHPWAAPSQAPQRSPLRIRSSDGNGRDQGSSRCVRT